MMAVFKCYIDFGDPHFWQPVGQSLYLTTVSFSPVPALHVLHVSLLQHS